MQSCYFLSDVDRETGEKTKVLLFSDTLAHLTIQSLIEQVFFRRALRFKKVKKLA